MQGASWYPHWTAPSERKHDKVIRVHEKGVYQNGGSWIKEKWINPEDISGVHIKNGELSLEMPTGMLLIQENFTELSKLIEQWRQHERG